MERWPKITGGAPLLALFEKWLPPRWRRRVFHHNWVVCAITAADLFAHYSVAMRRNLKRYYGAGDLHFITCSCYRREQLLGTSRRRDLFLTVLEQMRRRYQFVVVGYVVMPEHIHLLVSEPQEETPSTVMQALKIGFARRVIAEDRRLGMSTEATSRKAREVAHPLPYSQPDPPCAPVPAQHIWTKRFYDFNVWTEHKRIEKLRYMHRNPMTRGLVASPELWRWSSFRAYFLGEAGPVLVNGWDVLRMKIRPPAA